MLSTFPTHLDADESKLDLADVTVRPARPTDEAALRRLAHLEGRSEGGTPHLVAEHDDEVVASLSLEDGTTLGDPFRPTSEILDLLRAHAERRGVAAVARRPLRRRLHTALAGGVAALALAGGALAGETTVTVAGKPVRIVPSSKAFTILVSCTSTAAPCDGVLDVRTAGKIKPYTTQPAAVAKVGTFPFSIPAGTSAPVKGRVYGPALAQAEMRGRVVLSLTPRAIGGPLGPSRTVVFTYRALG